MDLVWRETRRFDGMLGESGHDTLSATQRLTEDLSKQFRFVSVGTDVDLAAPERCFWRFRDAIRLDKECVLPFLVRQEYNWR